MARKKLEPGFVFGAPKAPATPDYVVVELQHDSQVALARRRFEGAAEREGQAASLNQILEGFRPKRVLPHFALAPKVIEKRITAAPSRLGIPVSAEFAHAGFVQITPRRPQDCAEMVKRLKKSKAVWDAFVAPRPVPATGGASAADPNFEPAQGYLHSPPNGIGAMHVWPVAGGRGQGITICDIEGNWNVLHADLPAGIPLIGGTPINDPAWRNHGTAVLGEMISIPSPGGTVGISHKAKAKVHSAVISGVFNTAQAIANATAQLNAGDVILIELQATGPNGKYVAMQYWNDIFSAIRAATYHGVTVVEAAGNGDENFQLPIFAGTGLQKDSGAIVVGAGVPPTNFFDHAGFGASMPGYSMVGVPRSRTWFSNYGKIVNVQGWGWHVTTLGYGDAQRGPDQNHWYTLRFSGTSSASPIVTGAVACIQGRAKAKLGAPLSPLKVRQLLVLTGTPQQPGPAAPLSQHIGPLPNLLKAFPLI